MNIKRSLSVLAVGISLSACAGPKPIPAVLPENPGTARDHANERDWFAAALNINTPLKFRVWEPVVEEISGNSAVPHTRVSIMDEDDLQWPCDDHAAGCYLPRTRSISLAISNSPGARALASYRRVAEECSGLPSNDLVAIPNLMLWAHEQSHHFERRRGDSPAERYVNQIEARAFEYAFAEHVALHYDRHLGLNLIRSRLEYAHRYSWRQLEDRENALTYASDFHQHLANIDMDPGYVDDPAFIDQGFFALIPSGFDSFQSLWRYVHGSSSGEIFERIRLNEDQVALGRIRAEMMLFSQAGVDVVQSPPPLPVFPLPDLSSREPLPTQFNFRNLRGILHADFPGHNYYFARLESGNASVSYTGSDARSDDLRVSATRLAAGEPDISISVRSGTMQEFLLERHEGRIRATVFAVTAMANPSFCHVHPIDVTGEYGRYVSHIRGQFEKVSSAILGLPGRNSEKAMADETIEMVFGSI